MPIFEPSPKEKATKLTLMIRGIGPIPAFKNRKKIWGGRLVVDPKVGERMAVLRGAIASQLLLGFPIDADVTSMAFRVASLIQSLPSDDCWTVLPELHVYGKSAGEDFCEIVIERIE